MELKYLHTFMTILEEGSFAKAAEKLGYTQSTITFQIDQLEREFSVQLFEKIGRRMALTKAGEQIKPYIAEVLSSVRRMRSFETDLKSCEGDLSIGVAETQLCYSMPPILKRFHQAAPNARLLLRSMNCYEIRDALADGAIDIGIFYRDVGGLGSNLIARQMGSSRIVLVASPQTKRLYPDFITPDQQLDVPYLINERECIFRQKFERYLNERSIRLDHTIELWSIPTIINLVKSDVGISSLPIFTVQEELARGELVELPTAMQDSQITAVCAHHKNKWVSPLMQAFLQLCAEPSGLPEQREPESIL